LARVNKTQNDKTVSPAPRGRQENYMKYVSFSGLGLGQNCHLLILALKKKNFEKELKKAKEIASRCRIISFLKCLSLK